MASGASILLKGLCAPLSRVQSPCPRTSFLTSAASFLLGSCFFGPLTYSCIMWSTSARALAAAAKSHQSCPTLCDPIDGSPPGSPIPGILQARTLEWVAVSFSNACIRAKSLQSCPTLCDPIDGGPPGSPVPGVLQARTLEWVAVSFSNA